MLPTACLMTQEPFTTEGISLNMHDRRCSASLSSPARNLSTPRISGMDPLLWFILDHACLYSVLHSHRHVPIPSQPLCACISQHWLFVHSRTQSLVQLAMHALMHALMHAQPLQVQGTVKGTCCRPCLSRMQGVSCLMQSLHGVCMHHDYPTSTIAVYGHLGQQ